MFKIVALIGLGAVLALPGVVLAQQGTSSSFGTVGWGPRIPTQELTPKDRRWNVSYQALYQAEAGSEWLHEHAGGGLFPGFR
jgi:hypothetical protein